MPKSKSESLHILHQKYEKVTDCDLKKSATQAVYGHGNPDSEIVFIGEAPGKKEDALGIPFVGSAGKFLDEMLQSVGIQRDDIYITNIVKWRPPGNRDPLPEEKSACKPWLTEEINLINPKLIVFLGRHSMNDFFPNEKISAIHGKLLKKKFKDIECEYFLPLYHPASALYNGGMREALLQDFKKIPKILKKYF